MNQGKLLTEQDLKRYYCFLQFKEMLAKKTNKIQKT